ncbi:MAG: PaREP1 family protein, partial [Sulfolobus sp.]
MNSQILKSSAYVYLEEAEEFLRRGDTVQASEKYYKAAEEAIKILALSLNL